MSLYRSNHNYDITNLLAIIIIIMSTFVWVEQKHMLLKNIAATQQQPQHLWHHKYIQVKLFRSI